MAHGGKRTGSGRRAGSVTTRTREIANAIAEGLTPLEYLTSIYCNPQVDEGRRIDAAKAAAPYVHARLNAVDAKVNGTVSLLGVGALALQCNREGDDDAG